MAPSGIFHGAGLDGGDCKRGRVPRDWTSWLRTLTNLRHVCDTTYLNTSKEVFKAAPCPPSYDSLQSLSSPFITFPQPPCPRSFTASPSAFSSPWSTSYASMLSSHSSSSVILSWNSETCHRPDFQLPNHPWAIQECFICAWQIDKEGKNATLSLQIILFSVCPAATEEQQLLSQKNVISLVFSSCHPTSANWEEFKDTRG